MEAKKTQWNNTNNNKYNNIVIQNHKDMNVILSLLMWLSKFLICI